MRIPMFLVVVAAAFAASSPQQYTAPTFAQVGRLMGVVKEADGSPPAYASAVVRPYYARGLEEHADALLAQCAAE